MQGKTLKSKCWLKNVSVADFDKETPQFCICNQWWTGQAGPRPWPRPIHNKLIKCQILRFCVFLKLGTWHSWVSIKTSWSNKVYSGIKRIFFVLFDEIFNFFLQNTSCNYGRVRPAADFFFWKVIPRPWLLADALAVHHWCRPVIFLLVLEVLVVLVVRKELVVFVGGIFERVKSIGR